MIEFYSFNDEIDESDIINLLAIFKDFILKNIKFILNYSNLLETSFLTKFIPNYKRISRVIFYNSNKNKFESIKRSGILYIEKSISTDDCGMICPSNFDLNIKKVTESMRFNSCLNKKICINEEGDLKNCFSQKVSFGNFANNNIKEIINNSEITKLWKVTKDKIETCQDCEYRYICTDCRIFIKDEKNILSKPSKCNYSSVNCKWT